MTGVFGILDSSAKQRYQDVTSLVYGNSGVAINFIKTPVAREPRHLGLLFLTRSFAS
jgi:hypothetical protein